MDNELSLKPISDLLNLEFLIPAYQRGYRWTPRQVEDLLNDIRDFQRESESEKKGVFYCLQPVVVKATSHSNEWELVDGQQRLTTIYLVLEYLKDIVHLLQKSPYGIRYETRPDSAAFLKNIDVEKKHINIDYFHICNAYEAIKTWFESQDGTYRIRFLQTLLNDDDAGKNVKIIWYDIKEDIDPVDVFTRLNIGKIPLTNAELIKALFLRSRNFATSDVILKQILIAQEWDFIEKSMQDDSFWYFIHNQNTYSNRIEFLLRLIADEIGNATDAKNDHYYVFIAYSRLFGAAPSEQAIENEWERIKKSYMSLEEWYLDRDFYHLAGYLINQGLTVHQLKDLFKNADTKLAFIDSLKEAAFANLFGRSSPRLLSLNRQALHAFIVNTLNDWSYGSEKIKPTLLLFNIATLVRSRASNFRFQFDSYKKENWDIEHVRSVKSGKPQRVDLQRTWIANLVTHITGTENRAAQMDLIAGIEDSTQKSRLERALRLIEEFDTDEFNKLYDEFLTHFHEQEERDTDNSIGNLALLDASTNRSYQNSVFPIKRRRVIELDRSVTFVPVCTKNVFLKYYSPHIEHLMSWREEDRDAYQAAICETLTWLFADFPEAAP